MPVEVLIVANVTVPLDRATDGMERSSFELIEILSMRKDLRLSVIAHFDSQLPSFVTLLPVTSMGCCKEYIAFGDGPAKWDHVANDCGILSALVQARGMHLIHDLSSSTSACIYAAAQNIPVVKTLRLHPSHPSNALTADCRMWTVHISRSQAGRDRWSDANRSSVIYDAIPVEVPSDVMRTNRVLSVGRVEARKGHDVAALVAGWLGQHIAIVGRVTEPEFAKRLTNTNAVTLLGERSRNEVLREVARSSALIWTPRIAEPGGRVVVEALRLGVPVYAFPFGIAEDIVTLQHLDPEDFQYEGVPLYHIRSLPIIWKDASETLSNSYSALYSRLLNERATISRKAWS